MTISLEITTQFGNLIAQENYTAAHHLLTQTTQQLYSPADLKLAVEQMTTYWTSPIQEVIADLILEDWPTKQDKDMGIVYISFMGEGFCEAVTVTLTQEADDIRIRYLEWGRP